jgi:hypothetical protein
VKIIELGEIPAGVRVRVLKLLLASVDLLMGDMLLANVLSASRLEVSSAVLGSMVELVTSSSGTFDAASVVSKFSSSTVGNGLSCVRFPIFVVLVSAKVLVVLFVSIVVFKEVLLVLFVQVYAFA